MRRAAMATAGAGTTFAAATAYYHRPSVDLSDGMWLKTRVQVRPNAVCGSGADMVVDDAPAAAAAASANVATPIATTRLPRHA